MNFRPTTAAPFAAPTLAVALRDVAPVVLVVVVLLITVANGAGST